MNRLSLPDRPRMRAAVAAHFSRSERGITLAIFAVALVPLLMFVALGVDGARIFDERRQAQNAADHAAIAAAYASCTATLGNVVSVAQAAGYASADRNGYDNGDTNDVTIAVEPGVAAGAHEYRATIQTTIPTTFAQVMGFAELSTTTTATARATGCSGGIAGATPSAIHAGGTSCPGGSLRTIEFNGNQNQVIGGATAYGGARLSGDLNAWTATAPTPSLKFAGTFSESGTGNTYNPARQGPVTIPPDLVSRWPKGWSPDDQTTPMWNAYRDSPARRNASTTTDKFEISTNGIYYTERPGGVVVEIRSTAVNSITVVNRSGPIFIGEALTGRTFTAFAAPEGGKAGAIFISGFNSNGKPCDDDTIRRSGEGGTWNGIWWAPNGLVNFSGNKNRMNGSVIAHAVHNRGGNENVFNFDATLFPTEAEPDIVMVH
jgi:Flp pilus assembly protein TadG